MLKALELDRALVAETNARIREIETEISKLQVGEQVTALKDSISVLHSSKDPAQQRLDAYNYPVLTLPNEIISDIFVHFLPTYPEPPPPRGTLSPTCLTHICHQWRGIALTTPALWRAINLRGFTAERAALLALLWLERSGRLPLSIRVADFDFGDSFLSVYRVFIPHRARWEHLDLKVEDRKHLEILDGPLPLLHTLSVYLRNRLVNPLLLQTLPLLRTVILDDFGRPSLILPWSQLTSLTLRVIYPADCISILRQTEILVSCSLDLWTEKLPDGRLVDVELLRLETLVFERGCDVWVEFMQLLITPALRSLEIAEELLGSTDPIGTLKSFISKSGSTLNELRIITTAYLPKVDYCKAFPLIPVVICDL